MALRTLRQQRGLALSAVAIESGLSASHLARIECCLMVASDDANEGSPWVTRWD
ncbi:MAG: hypothetical protein ACR2LS_04365 [Thermomicrobiales bacterium]